MTDAYDQFLHLIKQAATQNAADNKPFVYGHVASYDPKLHRIRCIIPSLRDSSTGKPILTPWMPLGSLWVGDGFGLQIAPLGGATADEPTAGELCKISWIDQRYGSMIGGEIVFNQVMLPPFADLAPGEAAMKHKTGSIFRMFQTGDVQVLAARDLILGSVRDVLLTAGRDFIVGAANNITAVATAIARLVGATTQLHADTELRYDADGTGVSYLADQITEFTQGVPVTTVVPTPPEIS